jgi:ubiquinone/menaquinone biosynthesis C-methylase UbiE
MSSHIPTALRIIRGSRRYNAWLYSNIANHLNGLVLDIGSGLGDIACQFVNPSIEEVILSDNARDMLQALKEKPLPLKKYRITHLDITDTQILVDYPSGIADTITCINVLEHIYDDVTALKHMKYLLKKSGKIVIFVPALPAIYGTLDTYLEHYRRYTKESLRAVLEQAGLTVKGAYYMNMFGILTWFFAGCILRQKKFHKESCHMLDRIVPFLRALEDLGSPVLGQSLIMVGQA